MGHIRIFWRHLYAEGKCSKCENGASTAVEHKEIGLAPYFGCRVQELLSRAKANIEKKIQDNELFSVGRLDRTLSESLAANLGLLELGEIDVVVNAIISLDGLNHFLENLSQEQSNTRFLIPAAAWDEFCAATLTTADALNLAVQALDLTTDI